jgi:multiple sugar transport system permease protein
MAVLERTQPVARAERTHRDWATRAFNATCVTILAVLGILWVVPIAWAIDTSIKPEALTTVLPTSWLASAYNLDAYWQVLSGSALLRWYVNSGVTSAIITASTVLFASMAGYVLSRVPFRGRGIVLWAILAGIMVPGQVLIIPLFLEVSTMHLVNTYWGVVLPQVATPIAVFIFKQFFDGIPRELEEAARIDGAGIWKVYWSVILPLSRPVIAAVTILTFVGVWNNLLLPLFVLSNPNLMTIPVGLATVQGSFGQRYADIQAGAVLAALPLIILYLAFQRQIVEGVTGSGLKG